MCAKTRSISPVPFLEGMETPVRPLHRRQSPNPLDSSHFLSASSFRTGGSSVSQSPETWGSGTLTPKKRKLVMLADTEIERFTRGISFSEVTWHICPVIAPDRPRVSATREALCSSNNEFRLLPVHYSIDILGVITDAKFLCCGTWER